MQPNHRWIANCNTNIVARPYIHVVAQNTQQHNVNYHQQPFHPIQNQPAPQIRQFAYQPQFNQTTSSGGPQVARNITTCHVLLPNGPGQRICLQSVATREVLVFNGQKFVAQQNVNYPANWMIGDFIPESINLLTMTMIEASREMSKVVLTKFMCQIYDFIYVDRMGVNRVSGSWNWSKDGSDIKCGRCKLPINSNLPCRYHPKRRRMCCRGQTEPCTTYPEHVFATSRLDDLCQFETTPDANVGRDVRDFAVVAIDTEMVYTTRGLEAARAVIVNQYGHTVLDVFIRPEARIIDYNTQFSGVRPGDLDKGITLSEARAAIFKLINKNSILIGHHLANDLKVLKIIHSRVVDTAILFVTGGRLPSLKDLAWQHLHTRIHDDSNGHDPVQDAKTCLQLVERKWKFLVNTMIYNNKRY